jgi:hypothetical protein
MTLYLVDAFDNNFIFLRQGLDDLALLAFIFTGQYDDRIALLHMQIFQ